jgi:hypothetical protein
MLDNMRLTPEFKTRLLNIIGCDGH